MSKKKPAVPSKPAPQPSATPVKHTGISALLIPVILGVLYFFLVCLSSASTIKVTAMTAVIVTVLIGFACMKQLQNRVWIPLIALVLYVTMDGVSAFYAVSGKFALSEFLKVLIAFCLALILLAISPEKEEASGCWAARILATCAALGALISIDLLSTRIMSNAVIRFFGMFSEDYFYLDGVEAGVRMTSIFSNPNVFAGFSGVGVMLSLGLADPEEMARDRSISLVLLYVNALGFLLAFSMGASMFIALGFLVFFLLEPKERKAGLLILMLETLILCGVSAFLISATSFREWSGVQPVPLICTVVGAAALCVSDYFAGRRIARILDAHRNVIPITVLSMAALAAVYIVAAWNLTGTAAVAPGEVLERAAYPDPGEYSLSVQSDAEVLVTIESQDRKETMMHTGSTLYDGPADGASFTVPEGSLVTFFRFSAPDGGIIASASYAGASGSEKLPLGYKLLPGFIARRLQGLLANENAIQRTVFFEDGLKLFQRSPVIGLGMGAFENGIKSVQRFYYETRYAHNHYIQLLVETGVIGLTLFLFLLFVSGWAVWKARNDVVLAPALGAALVFMAGHAITEVVFSAYPYLPMAFGVFALINLCCGEKIEKPELGLGFKKAVLGVTAVLAVTFSVFLGRNMYAAHLVEKEPTFRTFDKACELDRFEWQDYALSYVISAQAYYDDLGDPIKGKANQYAARLAQRDSNVIAYYLAEYYFTAGNTGRAVRMVEKYLNYVSSDETAWQNAFHLLQSYESSDEMYREGVKTIIEMLDKWNADNMGAIVLDDESQAFVERYR